MRFSTIEIKRFYLSLALGLGFSLWGCDPQPGDRAGQEPDPAHSDPFPATDSNAPGPTQDPSLIDGAPFPGGNGAGDQSLPGPSDVTPGATTENSPLIHGTHFSALAYPGQDGRLVYRPDDQGNIIPDFSNVGYLGGGVKLPDVPVAATVSPGAGDDGQRIQQAITQVSQRPLVNGFRGTVLLTKGSYQIAGSITIGASGVVLRGEGNTDQGTVLVATGTKQRALIMVKGEGSRKEMPNSRVRISGAYVPVGARSLVVTSAKGFTAGDQVVVLRPGTDAWIHDLGMDRIPSKADDPVTQWTADSYNLHFERRITRIEGNTIDLDAPVMQAMEDRYGGGFLYKYEFAGRITQVGIESLKLVSEYQAGKETSDEAHAWDAITLDRVENAWVRRVSAFHFGYSAVNVQQYAKHVTVEDCECIDPVSQITGGRRYSFVLSGSLTLFQRNQTRNGRHDYVTHARVTGPNVFLDSAATVTHADIGPHHRWAVGTLYDNIRGGEINVQDRGNSGTGHGWAGAQQVFWNCTAKSSICQRPPTAQNYNIGFIGNKAAGWNPRPDCHWESPGRPVSVRSLYLKQLEDRLGLGAVRTIATSSQLQPPAEATAPADPCATGIANGQACCEARCGSCGGSGCSQLPGGAASCCTGNILQSNRPCSQFAPPCVL